MNYTITIEIKESYLRVAVHGENTLKNVLECFDKIYVACREYNRNAVLIEENLTGPNLDTFEIFEVIVRNFSKARTIGLRLAYVDLNAAHSKRGLKFAENLAHIRGVNVRLFGETSEAIAWLLHENTKK